MYTCIMDVRIYVLTDNCVQFCMYLNLYVCTYIRYDTYVCTCVYVIHILLHAHTYTFKHSKKQKFDDELANMQVLKA